MKYTGRADSDGIAKTIHNFYYSETRNQEILNHFNNGYTASYYGIPIYTKPDSEFNKITLPQSLANYIIELEEIKKEYQEKQLEEIFE